MDVALNILFVVMGIALTTLSTQTIHWTVATWGRNQNGVLKVALSVAFEVLTAAFLLHTWATAVFGHHVLFTAQYALDGTMLTRVVFVIAGILGLAWTIGVNQHRPYWPHVVTMVVYALTLGTVLLLLLVDLLPPFKPLFEL